MDSMSSCCSIRDRGGWAGRPSREYANEATAGEPFTSTMTSPTSGRRGLQRGRLELADKAGPCSNLPRQHQQQTREGGPETSGRWRDESRSPHQGQFVESSCHSRVCRLAP